MFALFDEDEGIFMSQNVLYFLISGGGLKMQVSFFNLDFQEVDLVKVNDRENHR